MTQEIQLTNPETSSSPFDFIRRKDPSGKEYWSSRELSNALGYADYTKFKAVIDKSMIACANSGADVNDHFVQMREMVSIGSNAKREVEYIALSRYAAYLIAQNADPSKEIVAQAQTYFAVQTRLQEKANQEAENTLRLKLRGEIKTHNKRLFETARVAGVIEPRDYAIFQNHGYMGLYSGLTKSDIHARKGLKQKENILDHMGSTELAANLFRATQAEEKIRKEGIVGKANANQAHFDVGKKVREAIINIGGTMPENLPTVESIKKISSKKKLKKVEQKNNPLLQ